jgi:MFS family permease
MGLGYGLFPFATGITELILYRVVYAVGAAAVAAQIAVVGNDYTQEKSRGRLFGFAGLMNGVGVVFMAAVVAQIPALLIAKGVEPVQAGIVMFLVAGSLCVLSALVFRWGLKPGTPMSLKERPGMNVLLTSGLRAGRNPRIALAYCAAFAGRSDNAIKGLFISLWAIQVAPEAGITTAEALASAGRLIGIMGAVILVWTPLFGIILDRVDRVTGMAIAMGLAAAGYISMGFISSPLDMANLPAFILLSLGQGSAIIASVTLVGQEAPTRERGTIVSTSAMFGAVGILVAAVIGGRLFDSVSPAAPFVMVGVFQAGLLLFAVVIRIFYSKSVMNAA